MHESFVHLWEKVKKARIGLCRYPLDEMNMLASKYIKHRLSGKLALPPILFGATTQRDALGTTEHMRHGASRIRVFDENLESAEELMETLMHEASHWVVNSHFCTMSKSQCCCCGCADGRGHGHDDVFLLVFNHLYPIQ